MSSGIFAATTENLVGTYDNGTFPNSPGLNATITITATGDLIIDGNVMLLTDLILVKDQTDNTQNGIYYVTTQGDVGVQAVLTRSAVSNNPGVVNSYGLIGIISGTANASTIWIIQNQINTIGTDPMVFIGMLNNTGSTNITTVGTITTGTWNAGTLTSSSFVQGTNYAVPYTSYTTGTIAQSGLIVTITGGSFTSTFNGAVLIPASGSAVRLVYTGSGTQMVASLSQTIAGGTNFEIRYYPSSVFNGDTTLAAMNLFDSTQPISFGSSTNIYTFNGMEFITNGFISGPIGSNGLLTTSGNPSASQSGTTVTTTGTFSSSNVGRLIMWATGQIAFITGFTDSTHVTVTPSQTVAAASYFIAGTGTTDSTSMDSRGNMGTNNLYVYSNTYSNGIVKKVISVTGSTYITLSTDEYLRCNRAGTIGITLLSSPETGRTYIIKDDSGAAATNNITITPASGNIDGASTYVINTNYGAVMLVYSGSQWNVI